MSWLSLAGLGLSLFSGLRQSNQAKQSAYAGSQQAMYNAQQAGYFGQLNHDAMMEAAHINAGMTMEIAELNAGYIERAGERNLKLYGIQADEEKRRHIRAEKMHAGQVRAAQSGTGIQVNTGANLRYLHDQVDEGLRQRHFMLVRHAETKKSMKLDYMDRAHVTRESGRLQAEAIMANGAIGAEMALAESQYQQNQYMMQSSQYQQAGNQAGSNFMWGALGSVGKFALGGGFDDISLPGIFSFGSSSANAAPPLLRAATPSAPSMLMQSSANRSLTTSGGINSFASNFMGSL